MIPLGVFHEPFFFWAQSKHKTQTAMQFFWFFIFSNLSKCILNVIKNKKPISFWKWVFYVIPLGVFHEPIFWAQSKHKTQTTMQFFGFLFFLTYQNAF